MNSFTKLFTFSLLISWSCAATTTTTSSTLLAADTLRSRGYSIFASLLVSVTSTTNFSGTLFAPPDSAFSFASTRILNNHRPPPRPSVPILLYHTLTPPLILNRRALSSRDGGDELRTLYNNFCLYVFKNPLAAQLSISSSPLSNGNPTTAVKIRQPDLYVDSHLAVHGIDGVLNPLFGTRCSAAYGDPLQVNRMFLDAAVRALRPKGFQVVAAAMGILRSELLNLTSVTVLAVSDEHLFLTPGGFRYDFRRHVVPTRRRYADLAKMTAAPAQFPTLAPNKTVAVASNEGAVTVDGVPAGMREIYHNRWIVVISVTSTLDDVARTSADSVHSPPPTRVGDSRRLLSPSPVLSISPRAPSPSPAYGEEYEDGYPSSSPEASDAPTDSDPPAAELGEPSPATSPAAAAEVNADQFDSNVAISKGVEGWDLLLPAPHLRQLRAAGDDVERYQPSDARRTVNIADDVFFYI